MLILIFTPLFWISYGKILKTADAYLQRATRFQSAEEFNEEVVMNFISRMEGLANEFEEKLQKPTDTIGAVHKFYQINYHTIFNYKMQ